MRSHARSSMVSRAGRVAVLGLALACLAPAAFAADSALEGHWDGRIELPGQALEFDLDFARLDDGALSGDISIPAQNARDLPLVDVALEGRDATFRIEGVPGAPTFSGTLSEDGVALSGTFRQGGGAFPFTAERGESGAVKAARSLEELDALVEAALEDWKTPGLALAIVADGETVLARGYGRRDVEEALPVDADTVFAIGSATKAFTTFVMATLVDDGMLDWDEPVRERLPDFRMHDDHATARLTARDLVTHRSGLPRHDLVWYNDQGVSRAELVHRLRYLEPNEDLRARWQYNNLMYLTAGYLIEQLTGSTWEEAVRVRILEPLGMERTQFSVAESAADANAARPYLEDDDTLRRVDYRPIEVMGPAGSINSTASDMARWLHLQLSGGAIDGRSIVSRAQVDAMHTPWAAIPALPTETESSPTSYGLGWFLETYRGHYRVHHGGNIDGFSALVTLFPNDGIGVVAMVNKNGSALPGLVTNVVADLLLDAEPKDWIGEAAEKRDVAKAVGEKAERAKGAFRVDGTTPSRPLVDFAGAYEHPGYGVVTIEAIEDRLVMVHNGMRMPLEHWHYDVFNVAEQDDDVVPENLRVRFESDLAGQVSAFTSPFEAMVDPIRFERLPDPRLSDPAFLAKLVGRYDIGGDVIEIWLQGDRLVGRVANQPTFTLVPSGDLAFDIEGVSGYAVRFTLEDDDDRAKRLALVQPNGVYEAARIEE